MMTEQPDGSFKSNSAITFEAGSEFKCRDTRDWSGLDVGGPGGNYVVETAGTYYVVLTFKGSTGTITLIPA